MRCNYKYTDGDLCNRTPFPHLTGELCVFHLWSEPHPELENSAKFYETFRTSLRQLITDKDGKWRGFVFPVSFQLSNETIDFELDARDTLFNKDVRLDRTNFLKPINFTNAVFSQTFLATQVKASEKVDFTRSRFLGSFELDSAVFLKNAVFHRAQFAESVICRAEFKGNVDFSGANFSASVSFIGWRTHRIQGSGVAVAIAVNALISVQPAGEPPLLRSIATAFSSSIQYLDRKGRELWCKSIAWIRNFAERKKERVLRMQRRYAKIDPNVELVGVFGDNVDFMGVNFATPSLVCFTEVNMSRAYVRGTNLRGARFLNVDWRQPTLGRQGLYDEVSAKLTGDGPTLWRQLPILEETYRNVRLALEENKSYSAAADFYVGEMESHRKQLGFWKGVFFSVPALYRILTMYGTSVLRGGVMVVLLIVLHVAATGILQHDDIGELIKNLPELALRSIRLATLQQDDSLGRVVNTSQGWIDVTYRILTAIQVALLVFAFRTRIKRH